MITRNEIYNALLNFETFNDQFPIYSYLLSDKFNDDYFRNQCFEGIEERLL